MAGTQCSRPNVTGDVGGGCRIDGGDMEWEDNLIWLIVVVDGYGIRRRDGDGFRRFGAESVRSGVGSERKACTGCLGRHRVRSALWRV
jgi:hypothetical protein